MSMQQLQLVAARCCVRSRHFPHALVAFTTMSDGLRTNARNGAGALLTRRWMRRTFRARLITSSGSFKRRTGLQFFVY